MLALRSYALLHQSYTRRRHRREVIGRLGPVGHRATPWDGLEKPDVGADERDQHVRDTGDEADHRPAEADDRLRQAGRLGRGGPVFGSTRVIRPAARWLGVSDGLVGEEGDAVIECPGIDEAHGFLIAGLAEEALTGPEDDRVDLQPQFVDEVMLYQRAQELEAAGDDDVPVQLVLQF